MILLLSLEDSLHRHQSGIRLTCPGGNQTKLSAQMKSCLRVFDLITLPPSLPPYLVIHPDEGVDVVDVSLSGLLHHLGQHGLSNTLPT